MTNQIKITLDKLEQAKNKGAEIWKDAKNNYYIQPNERFDLVQCENLLMLAKDTAEKYGLRLNLKLVK